MHVHEARAYLGVMLAGPRLATLDRASRTSRIGSPRSTSRTRRAPAAHPSPRSRRSSRPPTTGRSSTCATAQLPQPLQRSRWRSILVVSDRRRAAGRRAGRAGRWSWQFFLLGAGFMLLEIEVDHPVRAVVGIDLGRRVAGDCLGADDGAHRELHRRRATEIRRPWLVGAVLVALLALNYLIPIGRVGFESRGARVALLRRARLQPGPVRRPAVRLGDQALDLARARLRHEPAGRDGRRRGRVPVAGDRLPGAAVPDRGVLRRGAARQAPRAESVGGSSLKRRDRVIPELPASSLQRSRSQQDAEKRILNGGCQTARCAKRSRWRHPPYHVNIRPPLFSGLVVAGSRMRRTEPGTLRTRRTLLAAVKPLHRL